MSSEIEKELGKAIEDTVAEWEKLNIDPDEFLKCAYCHKLMFDPNNHFKAVEHCKGKEEGKT